MKQYRPLAISLLPLWAINLHATTTASPDALQNTYQKDAILIIAETFPKANRHAFNITYYYPTPSSISSERDLSANEKERLIQTLKKDADQYDRVHYYITKNIFDEQYDKEKDEILFILLQKWILNKDDIQEVIEVFKTVVKFSIPNTEQIQQFVTSKKDLRLYCKAIGKNPFFL